MNDDGSHIKILHFTIQYMSILRVHKIQLNVVNFDAIIYAVNYAGIIHSVVNYVIGSNPTESKICILHFTLFRMESKQFVLKNCTDIFWFYFY